MERDSIVPIFAAGASEYAEWRGRDLQSYELVPLHVQKRIRGDEPDTQDLIARFREVVPPNAEAVVGYRATAAAAYGGLCLCLASGTALIPRGPTNAEPSPCMGGAPRPNP